MDECPRCGIMCVLYGRDCRGCFSALVPGWMDLVFALLCLDLGFALLCLDERLCPACAY